MTKSGDLVETGEQVLLAAVRAGRPRGRTPDQAVELDPHDRLAGTVADEDALTLDENLRGVRQQSVPSCGRRGAVASTVVVTSSSGITIGGSSPSGSQPLGASSHAPRTPSGRPGSTPSGSAFQ